MTIPRKPSSSQFKLSDQQWYQNSTSNLNNIGSMYGSITSDPSTATMLPTATSSTLPTIGLPIGTTTTGTTIPPYKTAMSLSNHGQQQQQQQQQSSIVGGGNIGPQSVVINVPDLLVLELHRDHVADVIYKHYTVRGLYKYVIDAISDKTGILQAAAAAKMWHRKTISSSDTDRNEKQQSTVTPTATSMDPENEQIDDVKNDGITGTSDIEQTAIDDRPANGNNDNPGQDDSDNPTATASNVEAAIETVRSTTTTTTDEDNLVEHVQPQQTEEDEEPFLSGNRPTTEMNSSILGSINDGQLPPPPPPLPKQQQQQKQRQQSSNVTYRERLGGYLHPRDMRRLVTPFSTQNEPSIIVRRHVILINYDPLRTIILRDRILVLVPDGADSLLSKLEQRVRGTVNTTGNVQELENSLFDTPPSDSRDTTGANTNNNNNNNSSGTNKKGVNKGARVAFGTGSNNNNNKKSLSYQSSNVSSTSDDRLNTKNDRNITDDDANEMDKNNNNNLPDHDSSAGSTTMDEWHEMASREWVNLPFELQCTDAVLFVVCSILQEEVIDLQVTATSFIERIINHHGNGLEDDPLTIIRAIKDAVQLKSNRVKSFVQSLHRLLDDDEDMALMNLSRLLTHPDRFVQPVPQRILNEESDEPELILEGHLQVALSLQNYCDVIQSQTHTAKELIDQRLDATRNKLLFANMLISVFTLCVTLGALIGSFFGMNLELPNNLAESDVAFNLVVTYTCIGCLLICIIIMALLLYTGTIPFRLNRSFRPVRIAV